MAPRTTFPSDKQDQFMVRFPDGMRDRLKSAAQMNNRSMNAEIVARLAFALPGGGSDEAIDRVLAERDDLAARLASAESLNKTWRERADILAAERDSALEQLHHELERIKLLTNRRIPEGLYSRISKVAEKNGRTVEEEVTQALERAFPVPRMSHFPGSDTDLAVYHWRSGQWHFVDWDTWGRFLSGDTGTEITRERNEDTNHFVVVVLSDGRPVNIIVHEYYISSSHHRNIMLDRLSGTELDEYQNLGSKITWDKGDKERLDVLHQKMTPPQWLPTESIPQLRETLSAYASIADVDDLLRRRDILRDDVTSTAPEPSAKDGERTPDTDLNTPETWELLRPFVIGRNPAVMAALADGNLRAAVEAAQQPEVKQSS